MTDPVTPADALKRAAQRVERQREAARDVSREIAERRAADAATAPQVPREGTP